MSRSQFRLLIVINQLLFFGSVAVQEVTDKSLPPELKSYLGIDSSVLNPLVVDAGLLTDVPYILGNLLLLTGLIASVGMCFGKKWGRSLYLVTFVAALAMTFMTDVNISTAWTSFVLYLATFTEGMILGLAYFSHVRRMFETTEEI